MTRLGRQFLQAAALAAIATGMGVGGAMLQNAATAQHATVEVPILEVDPLWPKPLPNEGLDRKSTRLNSSHLKLSRMPSSA